MNYHIMNQQGNKIASFVSEDDRDFCMDALADYYEDCVFEGADNV